MTSRLRWFRCGLGALLAAGAAQAAGSTAAGFLTLSGSARGAAMADAYGAVVDDASAIFWNPAGLSGLQGRNLQFQHGTYLESTHFDTIAYAQRAGEGAWGVGLQYNSAGDIALLDHLGEPNGTTAPNDAALSAAYAGRLGTLRWGGTVKYIRSKLRNSASTVAGDIGLRTLPMLNQHLQLAASWTHLGGTLTYDQESYALPKNLRLASATTWQSYTLGVDWVAPSQEDSYMAFGLEKRWYTGRNLRLSARGGMNFRRIGGDTASYTAGMGFGFQRFSLDYAYVTLGTFDASHRFSLNYGF